MTAIDRVTPGAVLRAWRRHAGLTQQGLAAALTTIDASEDGRKLEVKGKTTVANWEAGTRSPAPRIVFEIAKALQLSPDERDAFVGLWRAAGSVVALPPRNHWEHNFDAAGGRPAWMWLRCVPGGAPVAAAAGWGPFGDVFEVPPTGPGLLGCSPASLPNPPLQVTFGKPAWADFGTGIIPLDVIDRLGMQRIDGPEVFEGRFVDVPELTATETKEVEFELGAIELATSRFEVFWSRVKPHMGHMRPNSTVRSLDGARTVQTDWAGDLRTDSQGELVSQLLQPLERIKVIRRSGRAMSVQAAAEAANALKGVQPDYHITDNQIEHLERNGALPQDSKWTVARLDYVYELDGHLGIERTASSRDLQIGRDGCYDLTFPDFWVGPIWLQVRAPDRDSERQGEHILDLRWGHWRRLQAVRHDTVVTTRKAVPEAKPKLSVRLPSGWKLAAGTGLVPGAVDINHDWYPASFSAAASLVLEGFKMLRRGGHV